MPFTLSHPAVILPLSRRPLVASALVAGAVAPDLPYLLPQATSAAWGPYGDYNLTYTHEFGTGMVAGTIGALVLLALFHHVLARPLIALLPGGAAGRLADPATRFPWSGPARVAWITLSAAVGVLSHLLWDAVVHENGSGSWSPLPGSPRVADALWWVSTLAGALVLAGRLLWWWRHQPDRPERPGIALGPVARRWSIAAIMAAGVVAAVVRPARHGYSVLDAVHSAVVLRLVVTGAMTGVAVGVLVYSVVWLRSHPRENR
ncbi:DUF4184 family protein [Actinoplanes sp. NPDC049265]|uniref:DUF4184 family protein n=1 Tax=Actinoplanes sp. NPDC049265 TaxID=3363902 RepID=UPI003710D862